VFYYCYVFSGEQQVMASSIVTVSVIDAWKEGTTVDAIKAVQAKIVAAACDNS